MEETPNAGQRAYELHRRAVACLTTYYGGMRGLLPLADVPAAVVDAADCDDVAELLIPLAGLALRCAQLAAQASGTSVEAVLAQLGAEAATFPG